MAETLGVIAAALELGKVALELKQVCSSVKHAPENVQQLLEELEALEEVLQAIAEQEAIASTYTSTAVTQKCRRRCEKALKNLIPVCKNLLNNIKQSKIRGSIKSVFQKDFLERAKQDIEGAKTNLLLAQLNLMNVVNSLNIQQHSSTQTLIVSTSAHVSSLLEDIRQSPQSQSAQALLITGMDTSTGLNPIIPAARRNTKHRVPKEYTRRLLLLHSRLLGKRIELLYQQAYSGWNLLFRTYNIRPDSWLAFQYVKGGDVASLRQLFDSRQASIFDRGTDGQTLLHYAMSSHQGAMIEFLKREGADPDERDFIGFSSLMMLLASSRQDPVVQEDALSKFTVDFLPSDCYENPEFPMGLALFNSVSILRRIMHMISPPWNTFDFESRRNLAFYTCLQPVEAQQFWLCLSQTQLDSVCLVMRTENLERHESLVGRLSYQMSQFWDNNNTDSRDFSGWCSILHAAVRAGGLRTAFEHGCRSPMLVYLGGDIYDHFGYYRASRSRASLNSQRLTYKLRHWAQEVLNAGQDLTEYGRWESQYLLSGEPFALREGSLSIHIVNFVYGKRPEDWQIWISTSADEYTAEFWESLNALDEEPVLELPGAWPAIEESARDIRRYWEGRNRHEYSRRKRRRWLRYMNLTMKDEEDEFVEGWRMRIAETMERGKRGKARRAQFFKEAGITSPY
ncbi:uncharacterized protein Z519_09238 [Cladophialophora bantiana CBS 173.52]|uniref:Azaphilone pigments biosynthesis cluster protein L N-terminal domain-containing protein n=1 Tax=Cladophialophora bantiana (strain ATCC 10958 / CBS 173.52 / CDC B-1940 / NIH 8579) TaxID=1442370 RepID=A0A0D2HYY2_CLAB1|nr:uncharacterized protein Z519_09238 [Cladophialophora bantiana CBS 173.52]KIW89809.1 hypothetical protein Z519_09238 [Cladophialophora bantiana CBS 173.52]